MKNDFSEIIKGIKESNVKGIFYYNKNTNQIFTDYQGYAKIPEGFVKVYENLFKK